MLRMLKIVTVRLFRIGLLVPVILSLMVFIRDISVHDLIGARMLVRRNTNIIGLDRKEVRLLWPFVVRVVVALFVGEVVLVGVGVLFAVCGSVIAGRFL